MTKVKFEWLPDHFPQNFFGADRCKKIWKGMIRYA